MVVDEELEDHPNPRLPREGPVELVHVVEKGVNDVDEVGQRQTEETQVDTLSHPVPPEHQHVDHVGGHTEQQQGRQEEDGHGQVHGLLHLLADQVVRVVPGDEVSRLHRQHHAAIRNSCRVCPSTVSVWWHCGVERHQRCGGAGCSRVGRTCYC